MNYSIWKTMIILLFLFLAVGQISVAANANPGEPVYGGTLRVALPEETPGLDPTTDSSAVIDRVLYNNVYQGLVRVNRDGEVTPALAKAWEIIEDGTLYRFYLREGVRFHNGKEFSAADVLFTLNRARGDEVTVANPKYFAPIEEVRSTSSLTVEIKLSRPDSSFLFDIARGDFVILPKGVDDLSTHPVGTGPFEFVRWKSGDSITLSRFESYYDEKLPYLDQVVFEFIGDPSTRIAGLKSGRIDAIPYLSSPEQALTIKEEKSLKVLEGVTTWEVILAMNNSDERLTDPLVRKAVNYAIDRSEVIEGAAFGFGEPIGSHMSPSNPNYLDLTWLYPHDPKKARSLLKEAGYPDGFKAVLILPANYELELRSGKIVADQLGEVGIDLKIKKYSWGQWYEKVFDNAEYDFTVMGHVEAFDISIYANPDYYFRYDNERFQEVIRKAESETDEETRRKLYSIAQWIIAEDVPSGFLFSAPSLPAMSTRVQNWWEDYPLPVVDVTEVWKEG